MIIKCTKKRLTFDLSDNNHTEQELKFYCKTLWRVAAIKDRIQRKIMGIYPVYEGDV